jgi:SNF2 family DNA or RNA helicase
MVVKKRFFNDIGTILKKKQAENSLFVVDDDDSLTKNDVIATSQSHPIPTKTVFTDKIVNVVGPVASQTIDYLFSKYSNDPEYLKLAIGEYLDGIDEDAMATNLGETDTVVPIEKKRKVDEYEKLMLINCVHDADSPNTDDTLTNTTGEPPVESRVEDVPSSSPDPPVSYPNFTLDFNESLLALSPQTGEPRSSQVDLQDMYKRMHHESQLNKQNIQKKQWKRFIGSLNVQAWATRPTMKPLQYSETLILKRLLPKNTKKQIKKSKEPAVIRLYTVPTSNDDMGREIGRIPEDLTRVFSPLIDLNIARFKVSILESTKRRLSIGDSFFIQIDIFLTDEAFAPINKDDDNDSQGSSLLSSQGIIKSQNPKTPFAFATETSQEAKLRLRQMALSRLFHRLGIRPTRGKHSMPIENNDTLDPENESLNDSTAEISGKLDSQKDETSAITIDSDSNDEENEPESGKPLDDINLDQLKQFYQDNNQSKLLTNLPESTEPPLGNFKLSLRPYQKHGLSWMLVREKEFDVLESLTPSNDFSTQSKRTIRESDEGIINPLWKCYKWPSESTEIQNLSGLESDVSNSKNYFYANMYSGEMSIEKPLIRSTLKGGVLADEMGLGKTIQTISLLTYLVEVKRINGPFLVIVPLSTLTNWNLEFDKWAPAVKKITYKGTPNQRKVLQQDIRTGNFQVLLTTFEYIIKDKALLSRIKWVHMIIDEGHRMKNSNSKLSETLTHNYHSDYRLILTGTPLQNNLPELWALLNFVLPKIFNSVKSFDEWFNTPFANTGGQDKIELTEEETLLVIRRLHKVLRPFLLRRLKKDVEKDLPNKVEKVVKCKMSSLQSKLYQQMLRYNILYASDPSDGATPLIIKNANNQIMQLRKICNHPFVYEEVENLINPAVENNDQIWRVAGKFELLDKVLPKFKATGHRVLIFFQMTQIMDIMEDFLRYRNLKYMRLDGGTKADDRTGLLKLFNAPDSEYFCFLLSTRAGGLGLNLQTADTVIIFDTDWNPHQDLQAQDRAHRIGQKNEVRILRLITEDSVEEMILERAHAKLEIDGKVIQAGKFDQKSTSEEQEAMLRALFEKEDERRSKGSTDEEDDMDDDELNQVIARNDNELTVFRKMDEDRIIATRNAPYPSRLYSDQELPEVYKKDPADVIKKDEIKVDEYGRGSRERKVMKYDDNLSEEQWLKKIDGLVSGDESDSDVELRPKRNKGRPRAKRATDINSEISSKADSPSEYGEGKRSYSDYLGGDSPDAGSTSKRQRANTPRGGSKGRNNAKGRGAGRGRGNLAYRATPTVDPLTSEERSKLQSILENILDCILDYRNDEGRVLSDIFMVKPPKRLYPDYYVLIKHPIALDTIKKRISGKIYVTERELLEDIHLMFSNARIYNEEGSVVYEDAKTLEHLAINKFKELTELPSEAVEKTLDFREFDETFSLKPLVVGIAVKHPVEEPKLDMDAFDLPDFPLDLETGDSTPAAFE